MDMLVSLIASPFRNVYVYQNVTLYTLNSYNFDVNHTSIKMEEDLLPINK